MITLVLRFSDSFAPKDGTLAEHLSIIRQKGYVLWGKKGPRISEPVVKKIMAQDDPKVILVKGKERYWAKIEDIYQGCPQKSFVPEYYRSDVVFYGSFLKVTKIERADENILDNCYVCTTGRRMSDIINKAMASYFIVEVK